MDTGRVLKNIVSFLSPLGIVFVFKLMQGESLAVALIGTLRFFVVVFPVIFIFGWIITRLITGSWKLPTVKPISASEGIKAEKSLLKFSAKLLVIAVAICLVCFSLLTFIFGRLYYGVWDFKFLLLGSLN